MRSDVAAARRRLAVVLPALVQAGAAVARSAAVPIPAMAGRAMTFTLRLNLSVEGRRVHSTDVTIRVGWFRVTVTTENGQTTDPGNGDTVHIELPLLINAR